MEDRIAGLRKRERQRGREDEKIKTKKELKIIKE